MKPGNRTNFLAQIKKLFHHVLILSLLFFLLACDSQTATTTITAWPVPTVQRNIPDTKSDPSYLIFRDRLKYEVFRFNIETGKLEQIVDPTDVNEAHMIQQEFVLSPDKTKLAVITSTSYNDRTPSYKANLWITDLSGSSLKLFFSGPLIPDDYTYYGTHWNNTSDGLSYISFHDSMSGPPTSATVNFFSLKTTRVESRVSPESVCGSDVMKSFWNDFSISWSTTKGEIYCLHQAMDKKSEPTTYYDALIVTSFDGKKSRTLKFPSLIKAPNFTFDPFSPAANYLAFDKEVYSIEALTNQTGLSNKPGYTLQDENQTLCVERKFQQDCPIWSPSGRYLLYESETNKTKKSLQLYDTVDNKGYKFEVPLPCSSNFNRGHIAAISDSKQMVISCIFGEDENKTYNYYLFDASSATIKSLPAELNKLALVAGG